MMFSYGTGYRSGCPYTIRSRPMNENVDLNSSSPFMSQTLNSPSNKRSEYGNMSTLHLFSVNALKVAVDRTELIVRVTFIRYFL